MVGLVIVSHSRKLAEAACGLAKGVGKGELPIAFAGGAGEDHAELGTDATDIMEAIQSVNAGDGVVVLMDLGSAVLSARMAQQMLEDDVPGIRLCPAPLVEGAVAAAIQIGAGATADAVFAEARNALAAKQGEMDEDGDGGAPVAATDAAPASARVPDDAERIRFTLDDPNGMHTRPAADFVKAVSGFDSEVRIRNYFSDAPFVNGRSLNQIALSNIRKGDVAEVAVWGPQAKETAAAVRELVAGPFHGREVDEVPAPMVVATAVPDKDATPTLAMLSPGVALGKLFLPDSLQADLAPRKVDDPEAEVARLDAAVAAVRGILDGQKNRFGKEMHNEAAILDAQLLILDDAEILDRVRDGIRRDGLDAAGVYQREMRALADGYRALSNPYMRERAADVGGVAEQVLNVLAGKDAPGVSHLSDVVLCSREVTPASMGRWTPEQLRGILTYEGGLTSHVAILAKAMGIPALMGYQAPADAKTGDAVAIDANALEVAVKPSPEVVADFETRRKAWSEEAARDLADSQGPAATLDGQAIAVEGNVVDVATATAAAQHGAEGVGLLRTEFLFLDRRLPPTEDEQVDALAAILSRFEGKPVTVRTLDAGGDKAMPWLHMPVEANPFLGVRGVRLMMRKPEVFDTQLKALLRAGAGRDLRVMVPMIATLDEVDFCRDALERCHRELEGRKAAHLWPVRFGVMIETPAAALQAGRLAAKVDFFSIGTNDLTQYVMCAERGSKELAQLADSMHPAVLAAIGMVTAGAAEHGVEVAVCGEMASDPVAARALLGLGVRVMSMNAAAIGKVKRAIRHCRLADMEKLAARALRAGSAAEARKLFA